MTEKSKRKKNTNKKNKTKKNTKNNSKGNGIKYGINYGKNWKHFNAKEGHIFLRTIVPKSSIKDQFVPLQIRNLEQLLPLLAINDRSKIKKGNGSEKQNVLKDIINQKGNKPKSG
mgnify:CR=1 FL=1